MSSFSWQLDIRQWDAAAVKGRLSVDGVPISDGVFHRVESFAFGVGFTPVEITVLYPTAAYNGKQGLLALWSKDDRSRKTYDVQTIVGRQAVFRVELDHRFLKSDFGEPDHEMMFLVANRLADLSLVAVDPEHLRILGASSGSYVGRQLSIPKSDRVLRTTVDYEAP
ncbi:MAG: hypothetical protein MJD61_01130 [Proteobacteria bacterium]|nr:hypothetical protein [Pseudomonadota bacterium]